MGIQDHRIFQARRDTRDRRIWDIEDFNNAGILFRDTLHDASAILQSAVESEEPFTFRGQYEIEQQIELPEASVSIIGQGHSRSRLVANDFGAQYAVLKGPNTSTASRPSEKNIFADFDIVGRSAGGSLQVATRNHPMGLWLPYSTADLIRDVRVTALGNSAFFITAANNTRVNGAWAIGGGFGVTQNETAGLLGAIYSISVGSRTLTASASAFSAGDVGKNVIIPEAGLNGNPLVATIIAYSSGTSVTIDRDALANVTNVAVSWEHARASITAADNTLTAEVASFAATDVGRWVAVEGAGLNGGLLVTTIASYTSSTEVELTDAAITSAVDRFFYLSLDIFAGDITADDGDSRGTNDIICDQFYSESQAGGGIVARGGTNIWFNFAKKHGIGTGTTTRRGRNGRSWIFDAVRSGGVRSGEMDYGYCKDRGSVYITGGLSCVSFENQQCAVLPDGQAFFDLDSNDTNTRLIHGGNMFTKNLNYQDFYKFGGSMSLANIEQTGENVNRTYPAQSFQHNEALIKNAAKRGGSIQPETAYAIAAFPVASILKRARIQLLDDLLEGLLEDGVIGSSGILDVLCVMAAHAEGAAFVNLIKPGPYDLIKQGSPTYTLDDGIAGNGSSAYFTTRFIPGLLTKYQQDDACLGVWSDTADASSGASNYDIGVTSPNAPRAELRCRTSGDQLGWVINDATVRSLSSVTDGSGFHNVLRTGASASSVRKGNSQVATSAQASTGVPTVPFHVLGANGSGSRSARQIKAWWAGGSGLANAGTLSNALFNRLTTYFAGL